MMLRLNKLYADDDKIIAAKMIRYLLFYCATIVVLSLCSYFLDLIFAAKYDGGHYENDFILEYVPFYMIMGWMIFPLSIAYNYGINHIVPKSLIWRISTGIFCALIFGMLLSGNYSWGYYLGPHREIKNVLAQGLTGLFIELLRFWVVRVRVRKRMDEML
jgi:hypothetical protein